MQLGSLSAHSHALSPKRALVQTGGASTSKDTTVPHLVHASTSLHTRLVDDTAPHSFFIIVRRYEEKA